MNPRLGWKTWWLPALILAISTLVVFGAGATRLGFYYDDAAFLVERRTMHFSSLWNLSHNYIPGRNLHVLWQYLMFKLVGDPVVHLPALHLLQTAFDAALVVVFYLLLRRLRISAAAASLAAGLFAFWPIHGETHFWISSSAPNQVSTLFVLIFAWTSLDWAHDAPWTRRWWFWVLDAAAFLFALFTYEQVFFVLLGIGALRLTVRRRFVIAHALYLAIAIGYIQIKLTVRPGEAPALTSGLWSLVSMNISNTLAYTAGKLGRLYVHTLVQRVTSADWWMAFAAAAGIAGVSTSLLRHPDKSAPPAAARSAATLATALAFYVLAYGPIWLWYVTSRHHFLPSIGLFAAAAVVLDSLLYARAVRALAVLVAGAGIFLCAAACRGESRYWETSFIARKQLFDEIKPAFHGKTILVLQGFPLSLGPAPLVLPHDAVYGPSLFCGGGQPIGDLGSAPAPGGIFLGTSAEPSMLGGLHYYQTDNSLVVRFKSWEGNRLNFEINPLRPLRYSLVSSQCVASEAAAFAAQVVSARRDGPDVLVQLALNAALPPDLHVAATLSFIHGPGFYPFGEVDQQGWMNLLPMLLPAQGACNQTWRLHNFPRTDRLRFQFIAVSGQRAPANLGQAEAAITQ